MTNGPLVSILIPAYNSEQWLQASLQSAISQTWPFKEIIVVDDGSTDRTRAIADTFASPQVRVITQPNAGAAAARNTAFSLSRGDYIQWLDSDDLLAPQKIENQIEALSNFPSPQMVASGPWAHFLYRHQHALFIPSPLWCDLSPLEWLLRKMEHNLHMQTATWLVSRSTTEAAGPWDTRLLGDDDGEYFCRVLLRSDAVKFVPSAQVFYRLTGPGSLSHLGRSDRKIEAHYESMQLHIDHILTLGDSPRVRAACVTYLQNWMGHFHPERPDIVERARELASRLGGQLVAPTFGWKYAWLERLGGPRLAKTAQRLARQAKWSALSAVDKVLWQIQELAGRSPL